MRWWKLKETDIFSSTADRKPSERSRQSGYGNPQVWQIVSPERFVLSLSVGKRCG